MCSGGKGVASAGHACCVSGSDVDGCSSSLLSQLVHPTIEVFPKNNIMPTPFGFNRPEDFASDRLLDVPRRKCGIDRSVNDSKTTRLQESGGRTGRYRRVDVIIFLW